MFAHLRGILLEKHPNQAIVEAGGVGYDVTIAVPTFTKLPDVGAEVRLRIHTHVREDALALYGFLSQDEKSLFEKLISAINKTKFTNGTAISTVPGTTPHLESMRSQCAASDPHTRSPGICRLL